jgi:hypothetical protein
VLIESPVSFKLLDNVEFALKSTYNFCVAEFVLDKVDGALDDVKRYMYTLVDKLAGLFVRVYVILAVVAVTFADANVVLRTFVV